MGGCRGLGEVGDRFGGNVFGAVDDDDGARCAVVQVQGGGVDDCVGDRGQVRIVTDGGGSSPDQRTLRVVGRAVSEITNQFGVLNVLI